MIIKTNTKPEYYIKVSHISYVTGVIEKGGRFMFSVYMGDDELELEYNNKSHATTDFNNLIDKLKFID